MRRLKLLMIWKPIYFPSEATTAPSRSKDEMHQVWETAGDLTGCHCPALHLYPPFQGLCCISIHVNQCSNWACGKRRKQAIYVTSPQHLSSRAHMLVSLDFGQCLLSRTSTVKVWTYSLCDGESQTKFGVSARGRADMRLTMQPRAGDLASVSASSGLCLRPLQCQRHRNYPNRRQLPCCSLLMQCE